MIAFFHKQDDECIAEKYKERYTIAYETIDLTLEAILCHLRYKTYLSLTMGRANCHWRDQYCRKTGRELATQRMERYLFELTHLQPGPDSICATYTRVTALDEKGAIIDQNKKAVYGFHVICYRDSGKCRIRFLSSGY